MCGCLRDATPLTLFASIKSTQVNKVNPTKSTKAQPCTPCTTSQVRGVVLADEVERAVHGDYLRGAHVVVGVPSLLQRVLQQQPSDNLLSSARVVIVDEVDECFTVGLNCFAGCLM